MTAVSPSLLLSSGSSHLTSLRYGMQAKSHVTPVPRLPLHALPLLALINRRVNFTHATRRGALRAETTLLKCKNSKTLVAKAVDDVLRNPGLWVFRLQAFHIAGDLMGVLLPYLKRLEAGFEPPKFGIRST